MERSTHALTYKGSIPDAINEARKQKKLFVVYMSGEDENSVLLEQSMWVDQSVAEVISKCCIFLHLMQGNVDASQFSAIYPQNFIPSISVIGINGVMLWHHEGYISAEILKESIEKAWAALHLQEIAALLTVAVDSKEPQPVGYPSNITPSSQGGSSSSIAPSSSSDRTAEDTKVEQLTDSENLVKQKLESSDDKDLKSMEQACSQLGDVKDVENSADEQSHSTSNRGKKVLHEISRDVNDSALCSEADKPQEKSKWVDSSITASPGSAACITSSSEISSVTPIETEKKPHAKSIDGSTTHSSIAKLNEVHLNIRMPNGTSLQMKLLKSDKLRSVKIFADENGNSGTYDLAVPYPRKVFVDQDMNSTLSELGFANREALIVVPHRQSTRASGSHSSSSDSNNTVSGNHSSDSSWSYFDYVKKMLSYMNPLSFFGGNATTSNSEPSENDRPWQYSPDPSLQHRFTGAEASQQPFRSDHGNQPADDSVKNTKKRTSRPFGSNIHTLRHDEDQSPSRDRNVFWNGNSTQFGGDDDKK
ncbi:plant UBX domain-containing protein 11 [Typha latifolia]|uniref:plant UBX domain-containing protein 11 n=1 Tax=Typha latifolia TaxID=4733 RepID=UPI003C2FEFD5